MIQHTTFARTAIKLKERTTYTQFSIHVLLKPKIAQSAK